MSPAQLLLRIFYDSGYSCRKGLRLDETKSGVGTHTTDSFLRTTGILNYQHARLSVFETES